jgi:uncharacterized protein YuzE
MRITYDPDVDALAVDLAPGARSARLVKLGRGIVAGLDKDGRLISIEVLDAGSWYDKASLRRLARPGFILDDSFPPPGFYDARTWRIRRRGRWWTIQTANSAYVFSRHLTRATAAAKLRNERSKIVEAIKLAKRARP